MEELSPFRIISSMRLMSIGMPVHNGAEFLNDAVDSILSQSFEDFELIISDNASSDQTADICIDYARRDSRVRYERVDTNQGAARNFNRVFHLSSGKYFKWAAHDDICHPDFFARCLSIMESDPRVVLCYPKTKVIDAEGLVLSKYDLKRRLQADNPVMRFHDLLLRHVNCFEIFGVIRTAILRKTRLIENFSGSDRVLLAELALLGPFHEVSEFLFFRRHHAMSASQAYNTRDVIAWFDPARKAKVTLPAWRIMIENAISVSRTPLTYIDRIACYFVIAKWACRSWKGLASDVIIAIIESLQGKAAPRDIISSGQTGT